MNTVKLGNIHLGDNDIHFCDNSMTSMRNKPKKSSAYLAIAPDPDQNKIGKYHNYEAKIIPLKQRKNKVIPIEQQIKNKRDEALHILQQVKQ